MFDSGADVYCFTASVVAFGVGVWSAANHWWILASINWFCMWVDLLMWKKR